MVPARVPASQAPRSLRARTHLVKLMPRHRSSRVCCGQNSLCCVLLTGRRSVCGSPWLQGVSAPSAPSLGFLAATVFPHRTYWVSQARLPQEGLLVTPACPAPCLSLDRRLHHGPRLPCPLARTGPRLQATGCELRVLGGWGGPGRAPREGVGWGHLSLWAGTQCGGGLSALDDGPGVLFAAAPWACSLVAWSSPPTAWSGPSPGQRTCPGGTPRCGGPPGAAAGWV